VKGGAMRMKKWLLILGLGGGILAYLFWLYRKVRRDTEQLEMDLDQMVKECNEALKHDFGFDPEMEAVKSKEEIAEEIRAKMEKIIRDLEQAKKEEMNNGNEFTRLLDRANLLLDHDDKFYKQ
jgi:biopolymer transport protein ExbB/TolQ